MERLRKVLSSMRRGGGHYLLMSGQACVLYGGAEFSRDTDEGNAAKGMSKNPDACAVGWGSPNFMLSPPWPCLSPFAGIVSLVPK
jgi:hypothetical protein